MLTKQIILTFHNVPINITMADNDGDEQARKPYEKQSYALPISFVVLYPTSILPMPVQQMNRYHIAYYICIKFSLCIILSKLLGIEIACSYVKIIILLCRSFEIPLLYPLSDDVSL